MLGFIFGSGAGRHARPRKKSLQLIKPASSSSNCRMDALLHRPLH